MINLKFLIDKCEKTLESIEELQMSFTGLPPRDDLKYNFSNEEIEDIDETYRIISDHIRKLQKSLVNESYRRRRLKKKI